MKDPDFIHTYFTEEKIESFFFIILGSISLILSLIFLCIIKYSFFKGIAIPLLLIGSIQILVGTIVVLRSPKDILRVEHQLKNEIQKIKTEELPRMEKVKKSFEIYKCIEITLMVVGLTIFILFYHSPQTFWKGLGIGLFMQAGIMLSLDLVAKKRAQTYMSSLLISESNSSLPN